MDQGSGLDLDILRWVSFEVHVMSCCKSAETAFREQDNPDLQFHSSNLTWMLSQNFACRAQGTDVFEAEDNKTRFSTILYSIIESTGTTSAGIYTHWILCRSGMSWPVTLCIFVLKNHKLFEFSALRTYCLLNCSFSQVPLYSSSAASLINLSVCSYR